MKIGLIAPLYYPVPPKTYGGTEAVVYYLCQGLVKKGHDVTLFACKGTKVSAKLDKTWGRQLNVNQVKKADQDYMNERLKYIISESNKFDVIHNNDAIMPIMSEDLFPCPMVTTWHAPFNKNLFDDEPGKSSALNRTKIVSISNSQRKGLPGGNFIATVYNGTTNFSEYQIGPGGEYLTWVGRIRDYKGTGDAIKIVLASKQKLVLAGSKLNKNEKDYFNNSIKKFIDDKQIKFIGEVNLEQKVSLLQKAKAFLMPIHWEEPFGLVMIEALACGTPVIAYRRGSVPEIIEDGKNGFIVEENDIDGMVKAIAKIDTIDRKYCRESVKKRFSIDKMVSGYEEVYKKVIAEYRKEK